MLDTHQERAYPANVASKQQPEFISVRELARDLDMPVAMLHYYLERLKIRTQSLTDHANSPRFVRTDQVVDIVDAINAYQLRRPVPGMSAGEAARELGLAESTIRVLVSQGRLQARHVGTRLSFTKEEIARYGRGRRRLSDATA